METTDKDKYQAEFDVYTADYLKSKQLPDGTFDPKIAKPRDNFERFSRTAFKKTAHPSGASHEGWLSILMEEQSNRCCYCMRELSDNEVSVEHLIPKSFEESQNEDDEYLFYTKYATILKERTILWSHFDKSSKKCIINPYELKRMPHIVAHANLFPACKEKTAGCTCNHNRSTKRILPMMLMDDIDAWLTYDTTGNIEIHHADIKATEDTYNNLDINTEPLKRIRHLWYLITRLSVTLKDVTNTSGPKVSPLLSKAFGVESVMDIPQDYIHFFINPDDWTHFLQYKWFFNYYRDKFPVVQ